MYESSAYFENQEEPSRSSIGLGRRRRLLSLLVVLIGLSTFFSSLIRIEPAVLGRTQWSAWNVAWEMFEGRLPNPKVSEECERCGEHWAAVLWSVPKEYVAVYVLTILALLVVAFSPSQRMLTGIGGLGVIIVWTSLRYHSTAQALSDVFYGDTLTRPVHDWKLILSLGAVMAALLIIALSPDLDELL